MTEKKTTPKKKALATKPVAKKSPAKAVKKTSTVAKKPVAKTPPKTAQKKVVKKPTSKVASSGTKVKNTPPNASNAHLLRPTTFAEISRIYRASFSNKKGSVLITSTAGGEGTSVLAHMMAQRSAESGNKVLLVDLNMKNFNLSRELEANRSDWELNESNFDNIMDSIEAVKGIHNMFILPAPYDMESVQFLKEMGPASKFFEFLEKKFDHIIVDSTPVGVLNRFNADPVLLGAATRRTILVLMAGKSSRDKVFKAVKQLRQAGANIEGIVVNNLKNPPLKTQLLNMLDSIQPFSPGLSNWLKAKVNQADI